MIQSKKIKNGEISSPTVLVPGMSSKKPSKRPPSSKRPFSSKRPEILNDHSILLILVSTASTSSSPTERKYSKEDLMKEIEEVQELATKNVVGLLNRQENLDELCSKSEALQASSQGFAKVDYDNFQYDVANESKVEGFAFGVFLKILFYRDGSRC